MSEPERHVDEPPIRVMLVEDHPAIRKGLRLMLRSDPGIEIVAEAGDAEEALAAADAQAVDVVMMDVRLPGMDGVTLTRELFEHWSHRETGRAHPPRVIGLSVHDEPRYRERMMQAGASGYLVKSGNSAEMIAMIRDVMGAGGE